MAGRGSTSKDGAPELLRLVVTYAKQEVLDPVVAQARVLGRGVAGAVLLATGTVLIALGFVRALQSEWGSSHASLSGPSASLAYGSGSPLSGDWSWVPYFGGAAFCLAVAVLCAVRLFKGERR
jgi:hypothetical protein